MGYDGVTLPRDTRFLVTGAAGFIGSNLVEALLGLGYKVRGLDNLSTGKMENIGESLVNPRFHFVEGDIRCFDTCLQTCRDIDFVLHQAALGSVPRSMKEPLIYVDNNVKGTANMMEAARQSGVKRFVYASSSSVYGDSTRLPLVEGEEGQVLSPYALTKLVNEQYGMLYTRVYGLQCLGLRYFNVFGRRQDPDSQYAAVIPRFIKAAKADQPAEIHGDGEQSRDFTYIENVIEANLKACLASAGVCGASYNVASGERITINAVYEEVYRHLGATSQPIHSDPRPGDIRHSLASVASARELLGYNPDWTFERGIVDTIEWYR